MLETIFHNLLKSSMKTYARIATIGTQIMHMPIKNIAKHLHHNGHSLAMVTPFSASHASYVDPDMTICTNDATSIPVIATGEINFQHINQYKFGREPVISSMSFENLDRCNENFIFSLNGGSKTYIVDKLILSNISVVTFATRNSKQRQCIRKGR